MKYIKILIASVVVVALLIFTAIFVVDAYNTGKIGNKDERVASSFVEDIEGSWKNTSSGSIASMVSGADFGEDGKLTVWAFNQKTSGEYFDTYDLDTKQHTLTVKGNIYGGLSIERDFTAQLDEDGTLTLKDTKSSLSFTLVRASESEFTTEKVTTTTQPKTEKSTKNGIASNVPKSYSKAILGKWVSKLSSSSGYEFIDESTVRISLIGVSTEGSYSMEMNENGECELCIKYISVAGVSVSNTYFVTVDETELTLVQKGAESVSVTYIKAQ